MHLLQKQLSLPLSSTVSDPIHNSSHLILNLAMSQQAKKIASLEALLGRSDVQKLLSKKQQKR